jgi:enoyl-CoA hydratase/carnithine racemase
MFGEVIAKEIVILGKKINAEEALQIKLLNAVYKSNDPDAELNDFLSGFAELKPSILSLAKQAIMDKYRTTEGTDLTFDTLALRESLNKH